MPALTADLPAVRYEILPLGSIERTIESLAEPLSLTVTSSPKHGVDHSVAVGCAARGRGHRVTVHLAARMVRGPGHLDALLTRLAEHRVADVFLVGGDVAEPHGPYASAVDLLPALRAHPLAPRSVGVAAYPEGHPSIADDVLAEALRVKAELADYMTTQLCFDAGAVLGWLERTRADGVGLPLFVGLPGAVDRRKLLEVSLRVGVGRSIAQMRRQQGIRRLVRRRGDATDELHTALAAHVGGELGIAGLHLFTFNRLVESVQLVADQAAKARSGAAGAAASGRR